MEIVRIAIAVLSEANIPGREYGIATIGKQINYSTRGKHR
jgi:hypothetical protein